MINAIRSNAYDFTHTSPYGGCWLEDIYARYATRVFESKVKTEADFREQLSTCAAWPELMIMGNFVVERAGILSICRELGVNTIHSEDGFFPHYSTMHADPIGFCWESSLAQLTFRSCSGVERDIAASHRSAWLDFERHELPPEIKEPFALWPLQLIGDRVNAWDLGMSDWSELVQHFRKSLPEEIQLVVKPHPRGGPFDATGPAQPLRNLPNTILVPTSTHLKTLLERSCAVAGANSSVLYEARLMFNKPVYTYSRGSFTNHSELFLPLYYRLPPRPLPRLDFIVNGTIATSERLSEYADWFLCQLLARQFPRDLALSDRDAFLGWVDRLTYDSYVMYGEDVFRRGIEPA